MRTKTLLLTAALGAAGVASSMAQAVYSVNAVGYVNTTLKPGFNLISNPLMAADNTVPGLFRTDTVAPSLPNAFTVYILRANGTGYALASYDDLEEAWGGEGATMQLLPGDGAFVLNPVAGDLTVTFVGEVPQGELSNQLPSGFSIQSSQVPQAGTVTELGLTETAEQGDTVYKFNTTTKAYDVYIYDSLEENWTRNGVVNVPSLGVGEAFYLLKSTAVAWERDFQVSP